MTTIMYRVALMNNLRSHLRLIERRGFASDAAPGMSSDLILKKHDSPLKGQLRPRQAWVESLAQLDRTTKGMVELDPEIFAALPRVDMVYENVEWQKTYKEVDWRWAPTRAEVAGGTKKPWPQKGTGRARQKDNRGPHWHKGGVSWGPRGPTTKYYMLPKEKRINGLKSMLSAKFAQDDLIIVEDLNLPTNDGLYLEALASKRNWGISVLYINDEDIAPQEIAEATYHLRGHTVMPVYGLNVYSMCKHDTLVLTVPALQLLTERMRKAMSLRDWFDKPTEYPVPNPRSPVMQTNTTKRRWAHKMKHGVEKIIDQNVVLKEEKLFEYDSNYHDSHIPKREE